MNIRDNSFARQLQRNAVALISLTIALGSLSYTAWRYEQTEENQNQRIAAFEILLKLGELQQLVFHHHYDKDTEDRGNARTGWTYVLTIRDLSRLLPKHMHTGTDKLLAIWDKHWSALEDDKTSAEAILEAIENTRSDMLQLLQSLE